MKFAFTTLAAAAFAVQHTTAHFLLNYPATVGFDDDQEGTSPCGGETVDFSKNNVTDFHVGGDALYMTSTHPQGNWLFRATLDLTAQGNNWTTLFPIVQQSGLGDFCEPSIKIPASWAGQKGVLQIIQNAVDGLLYQCAAVNFVSGTGTPPGSCKNASGVTASFVSDNSLPASGSSSASASSSAASKTSSATTSSSASATHSASGSTTPNAAAGFQPTFGTGVASLVWMVGVFVATVAFAMV